MSPEGSVSDWLGQLKGGDAAAAQHLWQHYFARLVGLARLRLQNTPRRPQSPGCRMVSHPSDSRTLNGSRHLQWAVKPGATRKTQPASWLWQSHGPTKRSSKPVVALLAFTVLATRVRTLL
jgi:hypothetical protein